MKDYSEFIAMNIPVAIKGKNGKLHSPYKSARDFELICQELAKVVIPKDIHDQLIQICKELISSQRLVGSHSNDFQALRDFLKGNE